MLRALSQEHHCEEKLHEKLAVVLDVGRPVEKSLEGTINFHPASEILSPSGVDFSPCGDAVSAQTLGKLSGFGICRW